MRTRSRIESGIMRLLTVWSAARGAVLPPQPAHGDGDHQDGEAGKEEVDPDEQTQHPYGRTGQAQDNDDPQHQIYHGAEQHPSPASLTAVSVAQGGRNLEDAGSYEIGCQDHS